MDAAAHAAAPVTQNAGLAFMLQDKPPNGAPHVVIAGAGAMGCLFGGLLAAGGLTVTLLARRADHVQAIEQRGLVIVGEGGGRAVKVRATMDVGAVAAADIVLFQCKANGTASIAAAVKPLFSGPVAQRPVAISFQNGLGNEEAIAAVLGEGAVLGGLTAQGATLEAPGVIRNYATLPSIIGEMPGGLSERSVELARLFTAHGLPTQASENIIRDKWRKLFLNVALSASSALANLTIGEVLAIPDLASTARRAMDEAAAVAIASGVDIAEEDRFGVFDAIVASGAARNKTSMCRDVLARRPSEVDAIYGSVIQRGKQYNIATPTLETLAAHIRGIESHYV
jgi:2-dehydropantoate 2-reductase